MEIPQALMDKYQAMLKEHGRAGIKFENGKPRLATLKELTSQFEREKFKNGHTVDYKKHQLKL